MGGVAEGQSELLRNWVPLLRLQTSVSGSVVMNSTKLGEHSALCGRSRRGGAVGRAVRAGRGGALGCRRCCIDSDTVRRGATEG